MIQRYYTNNHRFTRTAAATLLVCLILLPNPSLFFVVTALPTGAAACPANVAAVQGSHISTTRTITTGQLMDGQLQMTLRSSSSSGTETPLSTDSATDFGINQDYTLQLKTDSNMFRGFLFRLGPPVVVKVEEGEPVNNGTTTTTIPMEDDGDDGDDDDDNDVIMTKESLRVAANDDVNVQLASTVCITNEQVGGLTHANSIDKQVATGILRMDEIAAGLVLDVTVVVRNQGTESEYYYTQYTLNAVEEESVEVDGNNGGENSSGRRWNVPSIGLSSLFSAVLIGYTVRR